MARLQNQEGNSSIFLYLFIYWNSDGFPSLGETPGGAKSGALWVRVPTPSRRGQETENEGAPRARLGKRRSGEVGGSIRSTSSNRLIDVLHTDMIMQVPWGSWSWR